MLTGKCKEDFEKWYPTWIKNNRNGYRKFTNEQILKKFYREVISMQWGVYVDFFESLEEPIPIDRFMMNDYVPTPGVYDKNSSRISAVKTINKIYNSEYGSLMNTTEETKQITVNAEDVQG